jgi:hypothetical protein
LVFENDLDLYKGDIVKLDAITNDISISASKPVDLLNLFILAQTA